MIKEEFQGGHVRSIWLLKFFQKKIKQKKIRLLTKKIKSCQTFSFRVSLYPWHHNFVLLALMKIYCMSFPFGVFVNYKLYRYFHIHMPPQINLFAFPFMVIKKD